MTTLLEVKGISAFYGKSHVLQHVSLEVKQGEIVCLIGRNGAGKTTLIRAIMGLRPPSIKEGTISFNGKDITKQPAFMNSREGIGYTPQGRRIFPGLTVLDNLTIAQRDSKKGGDRWGLEKIFHFFPVLIKIKNSKGASLSGGELQAVSIARSLVNNPKLILLDEPSEGLSPLLVESMAELITGIKNEVSVLIAEQNVKFALQIADRGYLVAKGRIVYQNTTSEMENDDVIRREFLII